MCVCLATEGQRCISLDAKLGVCDVCFLYVFIAGFHDRRHDLKPFAALDKTPESPRGKPVMTLAAPLLLNDYCKQRTKTAHL